jgi:hypothetical protein
MDRLAHWGLHSLLLSTNRGIILEYEHTEIAKIAGVKINPITN